MSDLHGYLPEFPSCDLLLLAGDYCPRSELQHFWFRDIFAPWLKEVGKNSDIIGVAGNHDLMFEQAPELIPEMNWTYLQDSGCQWNGFNIWGTPHQPRFFDWAFNLDEPQLAEKWKLIPEDTDILILHGPPLGYGDFSNFGKEHTGSPSLLRRIQDIQPQLAICGHIHESYGRYMINETILLNCSLVDERYRPVNAPHVLSLNPKRNAP